jgi:hypothetical protein
MENNLELVKNQEFYLIIRFFSIIIFFNSESFFEISSHLGLALVYLNYEHHILSVVDKGFLELTIPGKPKSRLQKYRLTEKGRKFLKH